MKKNPSTFRLRHLAVLAALAYLPWMQGCDSGSQDTGASEVKKDKPVPAAASNLVASETSKEVEMPHETDSATEFPAAMESFAGGKRPELRDTGAGSTVVRVEKAPSITRPGEAAQPTNKPIEQDWDGTVLVPTGTSMSKAYTDDVTFTRIEVHPLKDGKLRVWVRVQNKLTEDLDTRVACNFKSRTNEQLKTAFIPVVIPASEAIDVYFMSPMPDVTSYTILVR